MRIDQERSDIVRLRRAKCGEFFVGVARVQHGLHFRECIGRKIGVHRDDADAIRRLVQRESRAAKLVDVETDPEVNVMGVRKGTANGPMLAVLAHLDTVFPEGTNVTVTRSGNRLLAPGSGDDTGALALMLSVIRAMDAAKIQTGGDILFVGNVGEEGVGDLRGVKYLLQKGKYKDRIKSFISIDGGTQDGIVTGALGSRLPEPGACGTGRGPGRGPGFGPGAGADGTGALGAGALPPLSGRRAGRSPRGRSLKPPWSRRP